MIFLGDIDRSIVAAVRSFVYACMTIIYKYIPIRISLQLFYNISNNTVTHCLYLPSSDLI